MSNKEENSENTNKESNCSIRVNNEIFETIFKTSDYTSQTNNFTESDDYASSTDESIEADDCSLSTENITVEMCEDNDHVEKMMAVDDKFSETTYSVKEKDDKLLIQWHIPQLNTDTTKTGSIFKCESCDLDFTTAEQLDNHTIRCQNKNKPDEVMIDVENKSIKEEVFEIDNYENYQTLRTEQDMEQVPIQIQDTLKKLEIKKENIEELIMNEEKSDINDTIFECDSCELNFTTSELLDNYTCQNKNKPDGLMFNVDVENKNMKEEVLETDNYENYQTEETKQDLAPIQIENTLEKLEIVKENIEEILMKDEKSDINDSIFECDSCELNFTTAELLYNHTILCKKKNEPDGVDYSNENLEVEVLDIDNYENDQTVIQQKENIQQDPLKIEDTLEVKKEINEEIIVKDARFDNNDDNIFESETCELTFDTEVQSIDHTSRCRRSKRTIQKTHKNQNCCAPIEAPINRSESGNIEKKVHPSQNYLECKICKISFPLRSTLMIHQLIHLRDTLYVCDVCTKVFSVKSQFNQHKRSHTGEKPYECDVCTKVYRSKRYLNQHKLIHTGERPYECNFCKKKFFDKYAFNIHERIHTGEKPYKCKTCKEAFSHKIILKRHKRIHTGKYPFSCNICERSFLYGNHLLEHKFIHIGEIRFKCDVCNKSYAKQASMENHKRIHVSEKAYECDVCKKSFENRSDSLDHKCINPTKPLACNVCKKNFRSKRILELHKHVHNDVMSASSHRIQFHHTQLDNKPLTRSLSKNINFDVMSASSHRIHFDHTQLDNKPCTRSLSHRIHFHQTQLNKKPCTRNLSKNINFFNQIVGSTGNMFKK